MKPAVALPVILAAFFLCSCNTTLTMRRNLYSPKRGEGYWTTRYHHGKKVADDSLTRTPPPSVKRAPEPAR